MADPTTTNKALAQPIRGSDVGTWDTPMNNNSGIIDNSFGGTATIALTNSNVTLSPSQYQCVFLTLTGAISANIQITLPAVGSFYTVQNLTSNTSAFYITMTTGLGRVIGLPPGEAVDILTDGTNVKFRNLGPVGSYWDYAGASVPSWVSACTVPPFLNCDGTSFSSATYPILATILGGTTLPDARGRYRATLNQTTGRITSGSSLGGIDGNTAYASGGAQTVVLSSQNLPPLPLTLTDPGHSHVLWDDQYGAVAGAGIAAMNFQASSAGKSLAGVTAVSTTGITISGGSTSPTNFSILPPSYIGGLTLIRAA